MTRLLDQFSRGITVGAHVRDARGHVLVALEECYESLLDCDDEVWSYEERVALGLLTAWEMGDTRLAEWFAELLADLSDVTATDPEAVRAAFPDLTPYRGLLRNMVHQPAGIHSGDVSPAPGQRGAQRLVVVSQIVGYLSYLTRLLDGLDALQQEGTGDE